MKNDSNESFFPRTQCTDHPCRLVKTVTVGFVSKLKNIKPFITVLLLLTAAPASWATNLADAYQDAQAHDPVLGAAEAGLEATEQLVPQYGDK